MTIHRYTKRAALLAVLLMVFAFFLQTPRSYAYKEIAVPEQVKLSPRLRTLFNKTKILCFGRYAIEVPEEAQLIMGSVTFGSSVEVMPGDMGDAKRRAEEKIRKLKWEDDTAESTYLGPGPIVDSWQMRYFNDKYHKRDNAIFFETYIVKGGGVFILRDANEEGETESSAIARQIERAKSLRLRGDNDVPAEPGFCIERGFMSGDHSYGQEEVSAGIYLPSFPDVAFSVSSNKDAYMDYKKERFEEMKRNELPLLARIRGAQKIQGASYPERDVLREGKRDVQHWNGEESLILRPDGVHDFEWAFVGTPGDVANPSEFGAAMFTKVEHNMAGAAKEASVSNDEAVALWDKLLSSLKFRVKVSGAPEGSYYLPKAISGAAVAK